MTPILTTITSYWNRPDMLRVWLQAVNGAAHPQVRHLIYFVNEMPPVWFLQQMSENIVPIVQKSDPETSIAFYHDDAVKNWESEWVMKLDIDTMPNVRFFSELLGLLPTLRPREWVNVGMLYLSRIASLGYFAKHRLPVSEKIYEDIMDSRQSVCANTYRLPAGTNFVCRRADYLEAVGEVAGFRGYGWEDYYQIYRLERHFLGRDPLTGRVDFSNVTNRCRDEISRIKAVELWKRNPWMCLLHHWHPVDQGTIYRNRENMDRNKALLLAMILEAKGEQNGKCIR